MPTALRHLAHSHKGLAVIAHFAAARALVKGRHQAGFAHVPDVFQNTLGPGGIVQNQARILGEQQTRGFTQLEGIQKRTQRIEIDVDAHHAQQFAVPAHALGHRSDQIAVVGLIEFGQHHAVAFLGRLIPRAFARIKARAQRVVRRLHKTAVPRAVINQLELRVDLGEGAEFVIEHALRTTELRAQRFDALGVGRIGRHLSVGIGHGRQLGKNVHNALGIADHLAQILSGQP